MQFGPNKLPVIDYTSIKRCVKTLDGILYKINGLKKYPNQRSPIRILSVSILENTIEKLSKEGFGKYFGQTFWNLIGKSSYIPCPELLCDICHIIGIHGQGIYIQEIILFLWTLPLFREFWFVTLVCNRGIHVLEHIVVAAVFNKCSITGLCPCNCNCFGLKHYYQVFAQHFKQVQGPKKRKTIIQTIEVTQTAVLGHVYLGITRNKISVKKGISFLYYLGDMQIILPKVWTLIMTLLMDGIGMNQMSSLGNVTHLGIALEIGNVNDDENNTGTSGNIDENKYSATSGNFECKDENKNEETDGNIYHNNNEIYK